MVESTDEPVDDLAEAEVATVGQRLRAAREEKGLSLEDVAAQTRIPRRHLESLETSDWERLPAPTYTNGFAKSYATVVGLDRVEIGEQLRGEMGGLRPTTMTEVFEPADPARTMPKWLVFGAIGAAVNEMREAQALVTPVMLVLMLPWLLAAPVARDPNTTMAIALSFIPPVNTLAMITRMASTSPPPIWQVWTTIAVGLAAACATTWVASKIFRVGLLMFGKPPNFATLLRWARQS